jgi:hypothetical protein
MLGLLFVWSWLRWRQKPTLPRALLLGFVGGWMAITRPIDAICIALPVAIATFRPWLHLPPRPRWATAGVVLAGAAPFLALQLVFNYGVTGQLTKTPFSFYNERDQPLLQFGFPRYDDSIPLHTKVPQKRTMYDKSVLPAARIHTPQRIPTRIREELVQSIQVMLAHPLLLVFLPAGTMQWFKGRRYVVGGVLPMFVALYSGYTLFLEHYTMLAGPAVVVLVLAGVRAVERNFRLVAPACTIGVAALCVGVLPEFNRRKPDVGIPMTTMDFDRLDLPKLLKTPALIFFKYENSDYHEEPVYNIDTAWPDDAPIIRVHDLGPARNAELLEYYAQIQPERMIYMVDRQDFSTLRYLGRAGQVWDVVRSAATQPAISDAAAAPTTTRPATSGRAP